jgi:hypothetical protein
MYARASAPGESVCVGPRCFADTALFCVCLCVVGSVLAGWLSMREAQSKRKRKREARTSRN